jgi:LysM repeat protein
MNKLGVVLGLAAVAVIAGCKDPDYVDPRIGKVQNQPVDIAVDEPKEVVKADEVKQDEPKAVEVKPVEEPKLAEPKSAEVKPVEPEYTIYIVQRGDYLAKISKRYNIKVDAIRNLNNLKGDVIKIGQKLKLPGKVEVGEQKEPAKVSAKAQSKPAKAFAPYAGATKEYVVKSGDTLGAIAYGNGINIRQLKQLNNLNSDMLKIGQKLKVPASKAAPAVNTAKTDPVAKKEAPVAEASAVPAEPVAAPVVDEPQKVEPSVAAPVEETPVAPASGKTHVVKEGEDLTGISITWGVSPAAICELNNINDTDPLTPGTVLKLPADAQQ